MRASLGKQPFFIVGLGNPGRKYARTRHNIGFLCLDHISDEMGIVLDQRQYKALVGRGRCRRHSIVAIKPMTYMNHSGKAVAPLAKEHDIAVDQIIVIHDDLDLPFSRLRVRPNGSSGGHRGVQSIIDRLGSDQFIRIRIGIGRPNGQDPVDYVLEEFSEHQSPLLLPIAEEVLQILVTIMDQGVQAAMNDFNGQPSLAERRSLPGD